MSAYDRNDSLATRSDSATAQSERAAASGAFLGGLLLLLFLGSMASSERPPQPPACHCEVRRETIVKYVQTPASEKAFAKVPCNDRPRLAHVVAAVAVALLMAMVLVGFVNGLRTPTASAPTTSSAPALAEVPQPTSSEPARHVPEDIHAEPPSTDEGDDADDTNEADDE